MNRQHKRAALVAQLAKRKEDKAAELLGLWRSRVTQQSEQMAELLRYQQAYLSAAQGAGQTVFELRSNRQFLTQLAGVIEEQQLRLSHMEQQFSRYSQHWQQLHQRRKMLEDYQNRLAIEASQALDKQWDKLCEELVARNTNNDSP